jgi:hypothetical protein
LYAFSKVGHWPAFVFLGRICVGCTLIVLIFNELHGVLLGSGLLCNSVASFREGYYPHYCLGNT